MTLLQFIYILVYILIFGTVIFSVYNYVKYFVREEKESKCNSCGVWGPFKLKRTNMKKEYESEHVGYNTSTCSQCNGSGKVKAFHDPSAGSYEFEKEEDCPLCKGRGEFDGSKIYKNKLIKRKEYFVECPNCSNKWYTWHDPTKSRKNTCSIETTASVIITGVMITEFFKQSYNLYLGEINILFLVMLVGILFIYYIASMIVGYLAGITSLFIRNNIIFRVIISTLFLAYAYKMYEYGTVVVDVFFQDILRMFYDFSFSVTYLIQNQDLLLVPIAILIGEYIRMLIYKTKLIDEMKGPPCPFCGRSIRTEKAKQCPHCFKSWS